MHGKGMVEGMSDSTLDFDLCEYFTYGKHKQDSHMVLQEKRGS
jgi:hypothetical protein